MKKIIAIFLIFNTCSLIGQEINIKKLGTVFLKLSENNSCQNQNDFFNLFPNTFESFKKTFGYEEEKLAPLYDDGFEYVQSYFNLNCISKMDWLNKTINITIEGYWQSDGVGYFQHELQTRTLENIQMFHQALKNRSKPEIESFFYFLFDGIHPAYNEIPNEFDTIKSLDSDFYEIIKISHKKAITNSGH